MQVALLSPVAASNEALHAQLNDLRKDLSQAQVEAALLSPETSRANAAEARCRQLEAELGVTATRLADVEDQLHSTSQSLKDVQGQPTQPMPSESWGLSHRLDVASKPFDCSKQTLRTRNCCRKLQSQT